MRTGGLRIRSNRRRMLVVCTALILWGTGLFWSPAYAAVDLTVADVEVTQAIQTATNSISLIAQRSTAVRATIGVAGSAGAVSGVDGRLHVFVGGLEITPVAGVPPINAPFTAPLVPDQANENHTLNFELPAPTGITATTDADFRVDVLPIPGEADTTNNSGAANNLTVANRGTPFLFFTRINWTPSGLGLPALADVQAGRGDAFVRGIYPVHDGDPNLYRQGLFPTLTYSQDADGDGSLEEVTEGDSLLNLLESCRQLIVDSGIGATSSTFLYGWINGNPIDGNGLGQVSGFVAYGNTQPSRYQRTYAHELGHNVGIGPHNNRMLDYVGWDTTARLPGNPGGNNTTGRVKPTTLWDIMVGGQVTNSAWVDTTTYGFFFSGSSLSGISSPDEKLEFGELGERVLVVEGVVSRGGAQLVRLDPVFRFPWPSEPAPPRQPGRYQVIVRTELGDVFARRFDARVHDDAGKSRSLRGYFQVMVPAQGEVRSVRIVDTRLGTTLARMARSRVAPEIRILTPEPQSTLGRRTTVSWEVSDQDTDLRRLRFQAAYSPDNGNTFVPIGVDLRGKSFTFNSTQIQSSDGQGLIRVFVSDGLNTSFADVGGLSTSAALYPPPPGG